MTGRELAKRMAQFYKDNPQAWTQGVTARDSLGECVRIHDETATQWCMVGLAMKLDVQHLARDELYDLFEKREDILFLSDFNDAPGRKVGEIIALLESMS